MKLSFSTRYMEDMSLSQYLTLAKAQKFNAVEIYDINKNCFRGEKPSFTKAGAASTKRKLLNTGIAISQLDIPFDISDEENFVSNINTAKEIIETASDINVSYVKLFAEKNLEAAQKFIDEISAFADEKNVIILIETDGLFADTSVLCETLDKFARDSLAACWNMYATYFIGKEEAELTIKNLGAYVKSVKLNDAASDGTPVLIGEGVLPVSDMINALRSVNYNGFVCLEWNPLWLPEIDDYEAILTFFESHMKAFGNPKKNKNHLYRNKAGDGRFIWKKEQLIDLTFPQVLDAQCEAFPDQIAFKYTTLDYTRTYSEFRNDVDTFARSLIAMGVRPGTHVAVWATNIPQWYIAFWATTKIGAVLVTVNTAYKIHEAEYLFRQSDTHTLIMIDKYRDSDYAAIVKELCPELATNKSGEPLHAKRLPFLRNVITCGFSMDGCMTWDEAIEKGRSVPVEEVYRYASQVDKDDVCNMQYTSGTTGFPKGVMLTHHNVVNNGKCIGDRMDLSTADRMMIQVPMFHCFGMVLAMTASMTHGASLMPLPYFSPKPALACINNEKITAFHGVPTMFIALLGHDDFPKTDFSHMRTGIMAGSPCPISVMQDVVDKMHMTEITIVYGQTEASPGCTMSSTDDPLDVRVATVGRALPEIECKIINPETGEECEDNVTGEFVARGYNIMKGYYKMPKATASAIDKDGWLHTGDLACRTPEGNFRITGRLKDMIIRGGENIYPKEIEEFIYTHPKVSDVQVIGVPDEAMGEEIMACVILKDGESMTEEEMKQYVRDHMAKHKVPKYVDFVSAFPMNAAGKILKYKMREDAVEKLGLQKADSIVTA